MKARSAKNKGKKFQNEIAEKIRTLFNLPKEDVVSTTMGDQGIDVKLSTAARNIFNFGIEAKSYARIAIYNWWDQTTTNANKEQLVPLLIVKANRKQPLAILSLDDFLKLIKQNNESKTKN